MDQVSILAFQNELHRWGLSLREQLLKLIILPVTADKEGALDEMIRTGVSLFDCCGEARCNEVQRKIRLAHRVRLLISNLELLLQELKLESVNE